MKLLVLRNGSVCAEEVPAPACLPGHLLVRTRVSAVSAGTEAALAAFMRKTPLAKAIERRDLARRVIERARREGIWDTVRLVRGVLRDWLPLGYSLSGTVVETGPGVTGYRPGDRVACAGAGIANHADIVCVPVNLAVRVPEGVSFEDAAMTTIGAIAMQGVRRSEAALGESVAVVGLGLIGQLTCAILRAAGCRVAAIDVVAERARRAQADACFCDNAVGRVLSFTGGIGADAVILTASSPSSALVNDAMRMCRKRGKVVVVGAVGMAIERSPFYEKEIDFRISCSYGPGRYDPAYEGKGIDYPIAYVRWTENRNMQEFLRLVATAAVQPSLYVTDRIDIADAPKFYGDMLDGAARPLAALIRYPDNADGPPTPAERRVAASPADRPARRKAAPPTTSPSRVGLIGAGLFVRTVLLPVLRTMPLLPVRAVASARGLSARQVGSALGASYCTSDAREVIEDPDIDVVLICSRHDSHAALSIQALEAGKHVFCEKPMALSRDECRAVLDAARQSQGVYAVGFNRRYAPFALALKQHFTPRHAPLLVHYRVNTPALPPGHWTSDPVEGGGRIVGEACHFLDFFQWLTESQPVRLHAEHIQSSPDRPADADTLAAVVRYADGSVATLSYGACGSAAFAKERVEVFCDGRGAVLDDFRRLDLDGRRRRGPRDKGHHDQFRQLAACLAGEPSDLITPEQAAATTMLTFDILEASETAAPPSGPAFTPRTS